jgi:hypothetical protein
MRSINIFLFTILATMFISSCQGDQQDENFSEEIQQDEEHFEGQNELVERMRATDEDTSLSIANTLIYTHTNGSTEEASAFLDKKENILKVIEYFKNTINGNYGSRTFYFDKGKLYSTIETYLDNAINNGSFIERHSFYDKSGKVIFSKQRMAEFEIDLEREQFKMIDPIACSFDDVKMLLEQKGPYETTFQGFASNGEMDFLIVGENKAEAFTSSLAVQHYQGDINKLLQNEKAYVGKPLDVSFERMIDETDFEFQVLLGVRIK